MHKFFKRKFSLHKPRKIYRYLIIIFIVLTVGERLTFGISDLQSHSPVLSAANTFPFYLPATFRHLAEDFGYEISRETKFKVEFDFDKLSYFLKPVKIKLPDKKLNIVWLILESWRWDMVDPEIMPATHELAEKSHWFTNHYSGGNCTRYGIFPMFYGIHGPYWSPFLEQRQSPIIVDVLQEQNYQFGLYSSQRWSYPEFNLTLFANVPDKFLHDENRGKSWEKDKSNVKE